MFCRKFEKNFFWPPFYIFDFFEENELEALYYFNCDKKRFVKYRFVFEI